MFLFPRKERLDSVSIVRACHAVLPSERARREPVTQSGARRDNDKSPLFSAAVGSGQVAQTYRRQNISQNFKTETLSSTAANTFFTEIKFVSRYPGLAALHFSLRSEYIFTETIESMYFLVNTFLNLQILR